MAFDGITIANITKELQDTLTGGRISKIAQPEKDELLLTIKSSAGQFRLCISASASLPLIYLTDVNKPSPMTAPNFCMLLRKHISNGRITGITQPGLERIIRFEIEHLDELGDLRQKELIVEIMGKHSNIIFCDENQKIIDSIKHVSAQMSSVREVLPGRDYFIPDTLEKEDPLSITEAHFSDHLRKKPLPLSKALYNSFTGISPVVAEEICTLSNLPSELSPKDLSEDLMHHLYTQFSIFLDPVREGRFSPVIYFDGPEPKEFSSLELSHFSNLEAKTFPTISQVLVTYYASKNQITRIRQKSADLRHVINTALERNRKKYDLQLRQLKDTEKRDKYRIYGELINTYGYGVEEGAKSMEAFNYYTNETIQIPLKDTLSAKENAQKYFDRYNKLKRTFEALNELTRETHQEILYLESIGNALDIARQEEDLTQLKEELAQTGYIRRRSGQKKVKITSKPFHYISSDGFHMYVGKNNLQNDELTFRFANGGDWWFHSKKYPGSHVIVKTEGKELPDRTFEEAARLAAHFSKASKSDKVEIDYVQKKEVKKPGGAKPGFVVYYTNYSLLIDSDISGIQEVR
ncbi:fibronectin-binding protein A [Mediterraneibacter butyricigenes]|uniref:Rqc2 homolog RqcH n=1 Tax=Mediterraneibacter butyricigenes TaxID=2316025 RepID=A0A391NX34_9FIRM|nr:NFACT RNA binding domain-containing protein [Mediterraneibacter butyricigenes]RGO27962.1 fibronectin/fibrinogen-binding protein [Dorea sp. OM02-2LB]RGV93320.1 fibronectin/fibrinogen-binding protein [Ruminococcus sp. AF14-10]GCA65784.1 fibronectin-binding protein A [Mediterraneibacter butyricigenes]